MRNEATTTEPSAAADAPGLPPSGPELWVPPSREQQWLLRHLGWLVSPADGRGGLLSRLIRSAMVAPMTQLTFASFDMQCFLYQVFHTTWTARIGHLLGMTAQVGFLLVALRDVPIAGGLHVGHALAAVFVAWYAAVALSQGLRAWALVAAAVVVALSLGAEAVAPALAALRADGGALAWLANPWVAAGLSSVVVAFSHIPEPKLPPRANGSDRWNSVVGYVAGHGEPPLPAWRTVARAIRVGLFAPLGSLNEFWAGLRLMPYGWLMVMFRLGYQPARWATLRAREEAALRDGNPAIDYVGVGGGAMLRSAEDGAWRPVLARRS